MKKLFQFKALAFFACAFFAAVTTMAQDGPKPIPSPRDSVSGMAAGSQISINYGAPSVRGRKIFGGLEPYGKVWRAGANAMTTFTTTKDIKIDGKTLPAGKYSLFITPGETEWKVIFNSATGQWGIKRDGSANDDPAKDVLVVTVKGESVPLTERMVYTVDKNGFAMTWETTKVFVKIK